MRWVALSAVVAALVSISSFGFATVVQVLPGLFDPDGTGIVTAHWVTRVGLPDDVGKANHALFLQKDGPTSVNASAFAVIGGIEGLTLTELGFDSAMGAESKAWSSSISPCTSDLYPACCLSNCLTFASRTSACWLFSSIAAWSAAIFRLRLLFCFHWSTQAAARAKAITSGKTVNRFFMDDL